MQCPSLTACLFVVLLLLLQRTMSSPSGREEDRRQRSLLGQSTDDQQGIAYDVLQSMINGSTQHVGPATDTGSGPRGKPGPRGPPGPPGPRGPPGQGWSEEHLLETFKNLLVHVRVRDCKNKKSGDQPANTTQQSNQGSTGCPAGPPGPPGPQGQKGEKGDSSEKDSAAGTYLTATASPGGSTILKTLPRVIGCNVKTISSVTISKWRMKEIDAFKEMNAPGLFVRGASFDVATGRFTAGTSGIYQFYANLHIRWHWDSEQPTSGTNSQTASHRQMHIRALICIDSQCNVNGSLQVLHGAKPGDSIFTLSVAGMLHLQAGDYSSVYVENVSHRHLNVLRHSTFSGILLGV